MKNRPEVTDEEIQGYMNFESVLAKHKAAQLRTKKTLKLGALAAGVAGAALAFYFLTIEQAPAKLPPPPHTNNKVVPAPLPELSPTAKPENATTNLTENQEREREKDLKPGTNPPSKNDREENNQTPSIKYEEAIPVEGYPHLYNYFSKELRYPQEALKDSIQGIVTVSFTINREGLPEKIEIENSLGQPFEKEVTRLIQNMPAWKPALLNGKPTQARISIPLTFQIVKPQPE